MGKMLSKILSFLQCSKQSRILMIGLDGAGKTTILYRMKLGQVVSTIPTVGFNVETVKYKNISFTAWDVGGQSNIRPLWKHYFADTAAIIYVVDSSDEKRMAEAREELKAVLESADVAGVPLLVMANKSDLLRAMSVTEVAEKLNLKNHSSRPWFVQPTCAPRSWGIYEALDWLSEELFK